MGIRNKDILGCLPLLASVLGRQHGVQVKIGGAKACTNGKVIMLPSLPLDSDAELLATVRGFLDHEAAHIRHTDFASLDAAHLDNATHHFLNSIEDWRVENRLAAIYPGCRQNLRWLIRKHFAEGDAGAGSDDPALAVLNYVLLTVRAWNVPDVEYKKQACGALIQQNFPGLLKRLDTILHRVRLDCPDTAAAIGYARQLAACLRQWTPVTQELSPCHEQVNPTKSSEPPPQIGAKPSDSHDQAEQDLRSDSQAKSVDAGHLLHENDPKQKLAGLFSLPAEKLPQHLGEALARRLEARGGQPGHCRVEVATSGHRKVWALASDEKQAALRSSNALRHRLFGLLQAQSQQRCSLSRRGKLHTASLYRVSVGNPRVFQRITPKVGISTAVHILLDASGSMDGSRIVLARQACYAVATALESIRGVDPAVTAFPGFDPFNSVFPLLRHGEKGTDKFGIKGCGNTPLAPALWWVMQTMLPLKENRKIILILTDGVPDDSPACVKAIRYAEQIGMEVLGIGIQHPAIADLLPTTSRVINGLGELAPAMFAMLQTSLLKRGADDHSR